MVWAQDSLADDAASGGDVGGPPADGSGSGATEESPTAAAILDERGFGADQEVLLALCMPVAAADRPSAIVGNARPLPLPPSLACLRGWNAEWVGAAEIVVRIADDPLIDAAWDAFLRGQRTPEAAAARRALALSDAEAAAQLMAERTATEEGLTLVPDRRSCSGFKFVDWAGVASPNKPWGVRINDVSRGQTSHGYYATTWEVRVDVDRPLPPTSPPACDANP